MAQFAPDFLNRPLAEVDPQIAAVLAETAGFVVGIVVAWRISQTGFAVPAATLFDRTKLMRMLAVNRDIMVRTAALIVVFLFFTAKGAREGDVTLAANSVLNNFLLVSAFFLDGLANAAQQLCGRAFGARDGRGFARRRQARIEHELHFGRLFPVLAGQRRDAAGELGFHPIQLEAVGRGQAQLPRLVIDGDKRLNPGAELLRRQLQLQLGGAGLPKIFHVCGLLIRNTLFYPFTCELSTG